MPKGKKAGTRDDAKYEALRRKGYSQEKSAKIANSGKKGSRRKG